MMLDSHAFARRAWFHARFALESVTHFMLILYWIML
ncbi:hypothetical protein MNSC_05050 [Minisyncoccus archaeophilus]